MVADYEPPPMRVGVTLTRVEYRRNLSHDLRLEHRAVPVSFPSDGQARGYGNFVGDPNPDQLARYFHLAGIDRAIVAEHRGDQNCVGVAVQLGTVRLLGTFLEDPSLTALAVVAYVADQLVLEIFDGMMTQYALWPGRWRHGPRIRAHYGYRTLTDFGVSFRLNRFLYAPCWTGTERPTVLFDRAVSWHLSEKVLLPGLSVLERAIAQIKSLASAYLFRRLMERVKPEQPRRVDDLLVAPEGARQSPLDRLHDGPFVQSGLEIRRSIARLEEIRAITKSLPEIDRLLPGKIVALALQWA